MASTDATFKRGNTKPFRVTLEREDGTPIVLTGSTVEFEMVGAVPMLPTVTGPAEVLEGTIIPSTDETYSSESPTAVFATGVVEYRWDTGETDVAGLYRTTWTITRTGGDTETVPNEGYLNLRLE